MSQKVYVVWWRTAGEKNFGDGPTNWVGAWTDHGDAENARVNVMGNWISTGIIEMQLNGEAGKR